MGGRQQSRIEQYQGLRPWYWGKKALTKDTKCEKFEIVDYGGVRKASQRKILDMEREC